MAGCVAGEAAEGRSLSCCLAASNCSCNAVGGMHPQFKANACTNKCAWPAASHEQLIEQNFPEFFMLLVTTANQHRYSQNTCRSYSRARCSTIACSEVSRKVRAAGVSASAPKGASVAEACTHGAQECADRVCPGRAPTCGYLTWGGVPLRRLCQRRHHISPSHFQWRLLPAVVRRQQSTPPRPQNPASVQPQHQQLPAACKDGSEDAS